MSSYFSYNGRIDHWLCGGNQGLCNPAFLANVPA